MRKRRLKKTMTAVICLVLLTGMAVALHRSNADTEAIPGLHEKERKLLRIWTVNAPGGGMNWLRGQLRCFEKQHPGITTYLRQVTKDDLLAPDVILPDVLMYMPGDIAEPESVLLPVAGTAVKRESGLIREGILRCGRWRGRQYGLPLCWGGWGLAIDSALEPGEAMTPAPTTLLGKPAATEDAARTQPPDYPLSEVMHAGCPLQSPGGAALFTLGLLLKEHPPLPDDFAALPAEEVYAAFRQRRCATAMLTTGQLTAFSSLVSSGAGFPFRVMVADEVITDQVWLAGITPGAPEEAGMLVGYLTGTEAQQALFGQGLHTVRADVSLYTTGVSAQIERAARHSLAVINAFIDHDAVQHAAWQFFQGTASLSEALLPLL